MPFYLTYPVDIVFGIAVIVLFYACLIGLAMLYFELVAVWRRWFK